MNNQLFDYKEWCPIAGVARIQFENCILKVPIGTHRIGDRITAIEVDYESGTLSILDENWNYLEKYQLRIALEEIIP